MNNDRHEIGPRHEDSFARTLRSSEDVRFPSRHSNRNGQLTDTPTDESTLPRTTIVQKPPPPTYQPPTYQPSRLFSQRSDSYPLESFSQKSLGSDLSVPPPVHSTPKSYVTSYVDEHDSRELIDHLQNSITALESHMYIVKEHAKGQMQRLDRAYKDREEQLDIAVDLLANERLGLEQEKNALSTQLANTRVDLKNTRDQLRQERNRHSGDTQDLDRKLKAMTDERIKLQSELSGLKVKFNDLRRTNTEQKNQIENLDAKLKKSNETNSKLMTSNSQIRIQNERFQHRIEQLEEQLRRAEISRPTPDSAATSSAAPVRRSSLSTSRQNLSARSFDNRPASAPTDRPSRPTSSLRFSNRTQVRDITPPPFSSLIETEEPESPQGIGSEIHTTSCRDHCHLFEHEGDEGRFRWVCGRDENLVAMYREQRFVVFVPDAGEVQFFGEGPNKGQVIIFWHSETTPKELTVLHTNGAREEYRMNADGRVIFREVFNYDGSSYRIADGVTTEIDEDDATPSKLGIRTNQANEADIQVHHHLFGIRLINSEFLRVQVNYLRLQVTMCLCNDKRVFNVKHCSDDYKQKSMCTFLGQCPNMPIR